MKLLFVSKNISKNKAMKKILKTLLQFYLKFLAKIILLIHKPVVIAIGGSLNKTFTKNEIENELKNLNFLVRSTVNNFNTEIGLPLSILNLPSGYHSYKQWLSIIFKAWQSIFRLNYPDILILELGTSDPGDMKYLTTIIKPNISIIMDITKRYLESFQDVSNLINEFKILIDRTDKKGLVVLNYDDDNVISLSKISLIKIESFGLKDGADWQASQIENSNFGQKFKIKHNNEYELVQTNYFGLHHIYSILAAKIIKSYVYKNKKN